MVRSRWALVWEVPVTVVVGLFAMACFAVDDLWRWVRRLRIGDIIRPIR